MSGVGGKPYRRAPPEHREKRISSHRTCTVLEHVESDEDDIPDAERIRYLREQRRELYDLVRCGEKRLQEVQDELAMVQARMEKGLRTSRHEAHLLNEELHGLQCNYTTVLRHNEELDEKLVNTVNNFDVERQTMNEEIVGLTERLVEAQTTIDRLEEENERNRQDCSLAVQLLHCYKSHFRAHKLAELPMQMQKVLQKYQSTEAKIEVETGPEFNKNTGLGSVLTARAGVLVHERPEPLMLLSDTPCSLPPPPVGHDTFVRVDMTSAIEETADQLEIMIADVASMKTPVANGIPAHHGLCIRDGIKGSPSPGRLTPYPTPPSNPQSPTFLSERQALFSFPSEVAVAGKGPLPNCTYATRQAISLGLARHGSPGTPYPSPPSCHALLSTTTQDPKFTSISSPVPTRAFAGTEFPGRLIGSCTPEKMFPQDYDIETDEAATERRVIWDDSPNVMDDSLGSWKRLFVEKLSPDAAECLNMRTAFGSDQVMKSSRPKSQAVKNRTNECELKNTGEKLLRWECSMNRKEIFSGKAEMAENLHEKENGTSLDYLTKSQGVMEDESEEGRSDVAIGPDVKYEHVNSCQIYDSGDEVKGVGAITEEKWCSEQTENQEKAIVNRQSRREQCKEKTVDDERDAECEREDDVCCVTKLIESEGSETPAENWIQGEEQATEEYSEGETARCIPGGQNCEQVECEVRKVRSPKRMGVHHAKRRRSLHRAQEESSILPLLDKDFLSD
uniref:tight junction-associated protein 1-like n=1 Tax=Myxine glutinosa TaxID=7769 RepID=UPI00358F424F